MGGVLQLLTFESEVVSMGQQPGEIELQSFEEVLDAHFR
jgi:hypothetical protein